MVKKNQSHKAAITLPLTTKGSVKADPIIQLPSSHTRSIASHHCKTSKYTILFP
jgi:hypothetical protein